MHEHIALLLTAALILIFGLVSRLSERLPITAPMIFTCVGILVSPVGLGWFSVTIDTALITTLAEITLILILFIDATEIRLASLLHQRTRVPLRLLSVGLLLYMLLGTGVGLLLFDQLALLPVLLIAFILSPTDAALGQAIIKSNTVPESMRQSISVESGLNDGIALPPILVCMALLSTTAQNESQHWGMFLLLQLTLGPLIGALVGWAGGWLVEQASRRQWMSATFQRLSALSLALLAYALAEMVHGNGFIAAFIGGLFLGVQTHSVRERIQEFGEAEGQLLALFIFMIFGMIVVPIAIEYWDIRAVIYAVLSLTLIRMVPVYLSLIGTAASHRDKLFYGWFGPRGIASVLYLFMVVGTLGISGYEYMLSVIVLTVLLSIILHGATAVPLIKTIKPQ